MRSKLFVRRLTVAAVTFSLCLSVFPVGSLADDGADMGGETLAEAPVESEMIGEFSGQDPNGENGQEQPTQGGESGSENELNANDQGAEASDSNGQEAGDPAEGDVTDEAEGEPEEAAVPAEGEGVLSEPADGPEADAGDEQKDAPAEGQAPSEQEPEDGAEVSTTAARRDISKAKVSAISSQAYTGNAVKPKPTVKYGTATLKLGTDYTLSYKNNTKPGTATVTVTGKGAYAGTKSVTFKIVAPSVSYRTHVQNVGWQGWRKNGAMSGTSGRALRLEGINIKLSSKPVTGGIAYRTHVQNVGWQGWRSDGAMSGTSGQALRLEAIQVKLTGKMAERYDVWYRVHCQNIGWMGWARNGQSAGSAGYAYRLEGIQIVLVPKGKAGPGATYKGITQTTSQRFSDGTTKNYSSYVGTYKRVVHTSDELSIRAFHGVYSEREVVISSISGSRITFEASYWNQHMAIARTGKITGTIRNGRVDFTWKDVGYCHDEGTGYLKLQNGQIVLSMKVTKKDRDGMHSIATSGEVPFKKGTQHFYS